MPKRKVTTKREHIEMMKDFLALIFVLLFLGFALSTQSCTTINVCRKNPDPNYCAPLADPTPSPAPPPYIDRSR